MTKEDPAVLSAFLEYEKLKETSKKTDLLSESTSDELTILKDRIAELEFEIYTIRQALSTSISDVCKLDKSFEILYLKERLNLADWINTAKASREVAIRYGKNLGKSLGETRTEIIQARLSSLNDEFQPIHGTNSNNLVKRFYNDIQGKIKETLSPKYYDIKRLHDEGIFKYTCDYENSWLAQVDRWYEQALGGNSFAQYNLGVVFMEGITGLYDLKESIKWFELASNSGVGEASFCLCNIYSSYQSGFYNIEQANKFKDILQFQSCLRKKSTKVIVGNNSSNTECFNYEPYVCIPKTYNETNLSNLRQQLINVNPVVSSEIIRAHSISLFTEEVKTGIFFNKRKNLSIVLVNNSNEQLQIACNIILSNGSSINKTVSIKPNSQIVIDKIVGLNMDTMLKLFSFYIVSEQESIPNIYKFSL